MDRLVVLACTVLSLPVRCPSQIPSPRPHFPRTLACYGKLLRLPCRRRQQPAVAVGWAVFTETAGLRLIARCGRGRGSQHMLSAVSPRAKFLRSACRLRSQHKLSGGSLRSPPTAWASILRSWSWGKKQTQADLGLPPPFQSH